MSIFDRVNRIVKANIKWLLDKAESPEQELESKIKEMEEAFQEGRECAATYGATFRRMEREHQQLGDQQADLQVKAETAVKAGDDAMARKALEEKVKVAERMTNLAPGIDQGRKTYEQLRDSLIKLQGQLKDARLKLAELRSRKAAAEAHKAFGKHLNRASSTSADGVGFDRLEEQVLQAEAVVEIQEDIRGEIPSDVDLEARGRELQVEAQLRELKDRLGEEPE